MPSVARRSLLTASALLGAALILGACTTSGVVGNDVDEGAQAVDDAMQRTADDIQGAADEVDVQDGAEDLSATGH